MLQNNRNHGLLKVFCLLVEGSGSVQIVTNQDLDPWGPDPDPEHCTKYGTFSKISKTFWLNSKDSDPGV